MPSTAQFVSFLKESLHKDFSFFHNLKIVYRPYICPFDDLLTLIPERASVCEIGFGAGIFLSLVAQFKTPTTLGGIEIRDTHVNNARLLLGKNTFSTRLEVYDGTHLPSWVSDYDYIFMIDVLHHIPENERPHLLTELYELLKPGAKLIIKEIDASSPFLFFNTLHDLVVSHELVHEMKPTELFHLLESTGFKAKLLSKKRLYVYPHYTVLAEKR